MNKRNLVLINNATYQRETLSERPIRQPLSRSCSWPCSVKVAATDEVPPTKPILSESSGFSQRPSPLAWAALFATICPSLWRSSPGPGAFCLAINCYQWESANVHSGDMSVICKLPLLDSVHDGSVQANLFANAVVTDLVPSSDAQNSSEAWHLKWEESILISFLQLSRFQLHIAQWRAGCWCLVLSRWGVRCA